MKNEEEKESGPQSNPGEIINWPMLRLTYRTNRKKLN